MYSVLCHVNSSICVDPEQHMCGPRVWAVADWCPLGTAAGYYPAGAPPKSNAQAQIDMIEESLKWAGVTSAKSVSMCASDHLQLDVLYYGSDVLR